MGFLSLKELVDEAKKNGRKKICKNLKSKIPQPLFFSTVPSIPELSEHLVSSGKGFFSPSAASWGTLLKAPPMRRAWRYRGLENPGLEGIRMAVR